MGGGRRLFPVHFGRRNCRVAGHGGRHGHRRQEFDAGYLREVADGWNERIESWTYVADTQLSRKLGIEGYYIRIGCQEIMACPVRAQPSPFAIEPSKMPR